jgi:hypothetical protein
VSGAHHDDFAVEPIKGLPALLPEGETILWQGAPDGRAFASRVFRAGWISAYFGAVALFMLASGFYDRAPGVAIALSMAFVIGLGALAVGFFWVLGWAIGRTTVYTITNRRVVMRFGVALPLTVNLPFSAIEAADLRDHGAGSGDIALKLNRKQRMSYGVLWPHARPWQFADAQPMMRCLPDAKAVAVILSQAFAGQRDASLTSQSVKQTIHRPSVEPVTLVTVPG